MKMKRLFVVAAAQLMAAMSFATLTAAQTASVAKPNQPAPRAEFPASPIGKLGRDFIEALNGGNKADQMKFIASSFSESALKEGSTNEYLSNFQRLYAQSGGFDVIAVMPSQNPNELRLRLKSRRANRWVMLVTRLDKAQPEKLDGYGIRVIADPE